MATKRLPNCVTCGRPLVEIEAFLLLTCEDVICNLCTKINKGQAFCPVHQQQNIGQFLEDVISDLRILKATEDQSQIELLCGNILRKLKGGSERMGKFRQKAQRYNTMVEQETASLQRLREKFSADYDFKEKATPAPSCEDNFVICKICFRVNLEDAKVCLGCKERDYKIVWKCRGCQTHNQNGIVACQQCRREDEYQVQLFRKKSTVH
jgi:hypothetical protein